MAEGIVDSGSSGPLVSLIGTIISPGIGELSVSLSSLVHAVLSVTFYGESLWYSVYLPSRISLLDETREFLSCSFLSLRDGHEMSDDFLK